MAVGLAGTFALAAVLLTRALDALGLPGDLARNLAIAVLAAFGVALVVPRLGALVEGAAEPAGAHRPATGRGDGFRSGLVLGASLGLVYAPCAGPILAAVIALDAAVSAERLLLAFAYGVGAAIALLAVMTLGRSLTRRIGPHAGRLQQAFGALMVAVALLLAAGLDRDFQAAIADDLPAVVVNPAGSLEKTGAVRRTLARVHGGAARPARRDAERRRSAAPGRRGGARVHRHRALAQHARRAAAEPARAARAGRADRLLDLHLHQLPAHAAAPARLGRALPRRRSDDRRRPHAGVRVRAPRGQRARRDRGNGLRYPVALDNDYGTWNAWLNQYWPAKYLIDARGQVRYWHYGEGDYDETERAIRALLADAGRSPGAAPPPPCRPSRLRPASRRRRPTSAGGAPRGSTGRSRSGRTTSAPRGPRAPDQFALGGRWTIKRERAVAGAGARIDARVGARRVFLVLGSPGRERRVRVLLDGRPLPDRLAGPDVRGGVARVGAQRLYRLVDFGRVERRVVTLELEPGVEGYAFTFG